MKALKINLSTEAITDVLNSIEKILAKNKVNSQDIIRLRLSLEDNLMLLKEHFGVGYPVEIYLKDLWFRPIIEVKYNGEEYTPYEHNIEGDTSEPGNFTLLLERMGLAPQHVYKKQRNTFIYHLPWARPSEIQKIVWAVASAIALGIGLRLFCPESVSEVVNDNILSPIISIFLGLLGTVALPLIFFSSAAGIVGVGDREKLGRISGPLIRQFVGHTAIYLLMITALAIFIFNISVVSQTASDGQNGMTVGMLTGRFFPANFLAPFLNGETIQIVLLSIVLGVGIVSLGNRTRMASTVILELNDLFLTLMSWVGTLIPLFMFALLLQVIIDDTFSIFISAWKVIVIDYASSMFLALLLCVFAARKFGLSLGDLFSRVKQTFIVGTTTLSTMATLSTMMKEGVEKFGIDRSFSNVATPLAAILARYQYASLLMVYTMFFAEAYGIEIPVSTLCVLVIATLIMAIATPAVAGGSLASVTLLFTIVGVPVEAVGIVALIEAVVDFNAGFGIVCTHLEVAMLAKRLGMINLPDKQQ